MLSKKQLTVKIFKKCAIAMAAVLVAVGLVWFFAREIKKISTDINKKILNRALEERRGDSLVQIKNDLLSIGKADEKIEKALLPLDNILEFVGALDSLAEKHSIAQTLKFGNPVPLAGSDSGGISILGVDFNLTINGTIDTLVDYLKDLESLPYFSAVSSITLTATPNNWNNNSMIYIQAKLYVR